MSERPTVGWAGVEHGPLWSRPARLGLLGVLIASALAMSAGEARAGEYTVGSCQAAPLSYSSDAFDAFATRGMSIRRACNPEGPGIRGLVTRNVLARNPLRRGSRSIATLTAPPGTRLRIFRWAGIVRRADCGYAIQLYADGPGIQPVPIRNFRAGQGCPKPGRAQAAYTSEKHDVTGATRIVQRVICVAATCSARHNNYLQTYKATVTITDNTPPTASIVPDTPLAQGAWVNGTQPLDYDAADNIGVRLGRAIIGGQPVIGADDQRSCALGSADTFAAPVPCPTSGRSRIPVDTTHALSEGTQTLQAQAVDAAGNPGTSSPVLARIDNTAPARVDVAVAGGEGWRNTNDFAIGWANPSEGDRAPIAAARYTLCAAGTTNCTPNETTGLGIAALRVPVPAPGQWTVSATRRDQAGNLDEHAASTPVTLRYDPEPPTLGFEQSAAADPTQVAVQVTDKVSGLAGGTIEISRQGTTTWQTLPTRQEGSRLLTQVDDANLPAGTYVLRARAHDQAGNEASTDRRLDGQSMTLNLPLRVATNLQTGVTTSKTVRQRVGRRHHRHWVRRRVTVFRSSARARAGGHVPIAGRLTAANGQPVAGAQVQVLASTPTSPEALIATIQTDAAGVYSYPAIAAATTTLRFAYPGSPVLLPAQGQVALLVPGASSIAVTPSRVLNGQAVKFHGRLFTLPVPAAGKLIELQAFVSGRWQTFSTGQSDANGRWAIGYRFQRTRGTQRYRFRARIPVETAYAFQTGASRTVTVKVTGR